MEEIVKFIDENLCKGNIIECTSSYNPEVVKYCESSKDKDIILNYIKLIDKYIEKVFKSPLEDEIMIIHKNKAVTLLKI